MLKIYSEYSKGLQLLGSFLKKKCKILIIYHNNWGLIHFRERLLLQNGLKNVKREVNEKALVKEFQTGLIFLNFNEKLEKIMKKSEKMSQNMKFSAFFSIKVAFLKDKFKQKKEFLMESQNNDFNGRLLRKNRELDDFDKEIQEKTLVLRNLSQNIQYLEKTLQEKDKFIEELKIIKSKSKKSANLAEKIEGIETQVNFKCFKFNIKIKKKAGFL